jgi:thioesterase domain-containing protein
VAGAPLPDIDLDALRELDRDSLAEMALDVLVDAGIATPDMRADLRTRMRAFEANYRAALDYQPGRFDGPLVLITAADNDATRDVGGWAALAPALQRHTAGGDHYSMLRAPHVTALAAALRDALDGARR